MKKISCILSICLLLNPIFIYAEEVKTEEIINEEVASNENIKDEENSNIEIVTLEACVDGDTARVKTSSDEIIKIRFLAVDTPETVHPTKAEEPFGKEASEYTCNTLTNATEIKLEYDLNSDKEDNYGRKLVWVFTDGVLLQESLVSKGYAEVAYLYNDYKYTSLLQDSEEVAKVNKVGIWSIDEETIMSEIETKEEKQEKGFVESIIDMLLGAIYDFINELLESLLNSIEDML